MGACLSNPSAPVNAEMSPGAFYDDAPGGAVEAAARAAKLHKKKNEAARVWFLRSCHDR